MMEETSRTCSLILDEGSFQLHQAEAKAQIPRSYFHRIYCPVTKINCPVLTTKGQHTLAWIARSGWP
jgi:hypothetical protein